VVVISAGFGETGQDGRDLENRIRDLARHSGMRLVGPNCMGVINTESAVRLNATFSPLHPPAGNIGIFSQSGALGIMIFEHLHERHLGVSSFVAAGNRADVSNNDLIAYWAEDPNTAVIVLYLESVGNPRNFARTARDTAMLKPIVAVKSGRSATGRRVASSHSAALANRDVAVDASFAQAGVIRSDTIEALFDVVALLSTQPLPKGPRVGVVSNAGGPAVLFADACDAHGLMLPELQPATIEHLRSRFSAKSTIVNPVDMTASASPADLEYAMTIVGCDPEVDSLVAIYAPPIVGQSSEAASAIVRAAAQIPVDKPVLAVCQFTGKPGTELNAGRGRIPTYAFPENPAIALGAAWRYAQWRNRPRGSVHTLSRFAHDTIRAVVEHALSEAGGACVPSREEVATILRAAGIEIAQAEQRGAPNATVELRESAASIMMFAGVSMDPTFGPLIACGFGNPVSESVDDVAFRLHPVTDVDAADMIASLKASKLLDGHHDKQQVDRAELITLLVRVSALAETIPEMIELDLHPVSVGPHDQGVIVLGAQMRLELLR
jgi:acyl-CoA synthetase (NDP forming)